MVSKAQKVRLGIFLISGACFLLILLISIAGSKLMEKRDYYYILYDNVSVNGLQVGGQVMYNGIRIGRVEDISIDQENIARVKVNISIKKDTPIKEDTEASLAIVGITGLKQIELTGGTNNAKTLPPKSRIKAGMSLFDNIGDKAASIADKVDIALANVIELTNKENQENLRLLLKDLREISNQSKDPINNALNNVDSLTYELVKTTQEANKLVHRLNTIAQSEKIDHILTNSEKITKNIADIDTKRIEKDLLETTKNLNETVNKANILMSRIDALVQKNSPDITSSIETLRETLDNLNEFSRMISDDPSILINFGSKKQTTNP